MNTRRLRIALLAALALLPTPALRAASPPIPLTTDTAPRDTRPDTWAATDGLGRRVPDSAEVGPPRQDRFVAMFYFLWLDAAEKAGPFDVTKILASDPLAMRKPESPPWGPRHAMHHWGEPLFGYYLCDDRWVLRKHAQMLSDAGVDAVVFDTSNRLTYRRDYTALMETWRQMRREGNRTPAVAFLTPFGDPRSTVRELYDQLYSKGGFEELWFRWDGRPLILADPDKVDENARQFFTFRRPQPDYFRGPAGPDEWGWLEVSPQHVYRNAKGGKEEMPVGVAQNAVGGRLGSMSEPGARGRSFHDGRPATRPGDVRLGYNFAAQWERALTEDPKLIFVTGWNEWVAGRFDEFNGIRTPPMFVDEFDEEHSRDIEPMKGGHGDDYYYQLASYVRRFKGARPAPAASAARTIRVAGPDPVPADAFRPWDDVSPCYVDDLCDTARRDHPGFATAGPYRDDSGRNDLDRMKVARDDDNVYFYVRTRDPITEPAGDNWMLLFLDTDGNHDTGWEGYDFLIDRARPAAGFCTVERNAGGWKWERVGLARLARRGNEMHLAVPRRLLGLGADRPGGGRLAFDFKWADNVPPSGDVLDFLTHGDVAPNGRFNYRYRE